MSNWKVLSTYDPNKDLVSQILNVRGITDKAQIDEYINTPSISHYVKNLPEEFLNGLTSAKEIINLGIQKNLPIIIHGDYDADGICATAILYNTLKKELGYENTFYFIPSRFEHGYGLSNASIDEFVSNITSLGTSLSDGAILMTVDSGITAVEAVAYAKSLGISVIITDHHQKPNQLPDMDCLVWCDQVVGASVAWLLSRTLGSKNKQDICFAAIATVTDLHPLLGINRAIVKKGLEVINNDPPLGLAKLIEVAGKMGSTITAYDLGWVLGPRINASGRLVQASDAVRMFVEDDEETLAGLATKLNDINILRQDKTLEMFELASVDEDNLPNIIISVNEDYHEGIIGLVAARLVQKYYRPSIVISISDGMGKGSVRSIPGIDVIAFLRNFEDMFESLGGHPMAAGFSIKADRLKELNSKIETLATTTFNSDTYTKTLTADLSITADYIGISLLDELEIMTPFGLGNEEPLFVTTNFGVFSVSTVGSNKQHLLLKLFENGKYYKAIAFNKGDLLPEINLGDKFDFAYNLKKNEYNGNIYVDMIIRDLKKSE